MIGLSVADCGISVEAERIVSTLIVNGVIAEKRFPWTVVITKEGHEKPMSFGTGALVTPLHVLTATHLLNA